MNKIETEILIIGGGPAGSLCGIRLRQDGRDCVIVDRAKFPRLKLCAGVLTAKSRHVLTNVLGADQLAELLKVSQRCHEPVLRLWNGKECFTECDFSDERQIPKRLQDEDWRFVLVDRPSFDNWLIQYYKSLDGTAIEGDAVRAIDFDAHEATLSSGQTIHYKYLVACDGAVSHTEKLLAKHDKTFRKKGANAAAYEINVDRSDLDIDGINICFGYVPQTYAWAFSKGDKVCLGIMKLSGERFNANEAMSRFCDDLGMKNKDKYPLQGAMIPFDNAMPVPLWHDHLFFCGDAAGLDEPITAEGIFYALRSGTDAAEAIIAGKPSMYLKRNAFLQAVMHKSAKYQKLLASKKLFPFFRKIANKHQRFVGYFYLTQIDHATTDRLPSICWHYLRDLK